MAKKKHQTKKHKFKYTEATNAVQMDVAMKQQRAVATEGGVNLKRPQLGQVLVGNRDFSYVTQDLRRIIVMASALVVLEVGLWVFMTQTGFGDAIYRLIQV